MKIALLCNDTRGGVQPYVALALGLRQAGHEVSALAPSNLSDLFGARGVPVKPLSGDVEAALRASDGVAERGVIASMRYASRELPKILATWKREAAAAIAEVDVVTGGIGGIAIGLQATLEQKKTFVETHLQPLGARSKDYPAILLPHLPRALRTLGQAVSERGLWMSMQMSPPAASQTYHTVLYGFSQEVVKMRSDNRKTRVATGYWQLPAGAEWQPQKELIAFLGDGKPVVSVGFGSMANRDPGAVANIVAAAASAASVKVVMLGGWGGIAQTRDDEHVFFADAIPHDWLFRHVHASVHHCGAGTTGAALSAGIPSICVPFTMDQPFWAARVAGLGAGPAPIPRKNLTVDRLTAALKEVVVNESMRRRCERLGTQLSAERGVESAVSVFNKIAESVS